MRYTNTKHGILFLIHCKINSALSNIERSQDWVTVQRKSVSDASGYKASQLCHSHCVTIILVILPIASGVTPQLYQ
ncbi:hypothetical protein KPH14_001728 [Odynerus spinipes]|uniref:Uncharacterized protein n=1 Tax=Odynerus spinipes TaxID=1348599 RepID=A0AAD9S1F4_9HYME|nr:hypothetical protein KPH14_001728 [Odynerus spinipes]